MWNLMFLINRFENGNGKDVFQKTGAKVLRI